MRYTPHTEADVRRALDAIGVASVDELFADLPERWLDPELDLPPALDERDLLALARSLAARTDTATPSFLGGGMQAHFVPSVTPHLALQSEFVTAYTPYQPEVSQGILQATFEFQTMMSELTGLPIANASLYDGASAVAEAALLAVRFTKRRKVVVSAGVHWEAREVLRTYLDALEVELVTAPLAGLTTGTPEVDDDVACVVAQQPNALGYLEAMPGLAEAAHDHGALFVAAVDPLSLTVLKEPGAYGADIAVGEGQPLGNPLQYGGPHFGFMVVAERLLRQLPGRLVGETRDVDGRRGYTLTLQAREQHIRRSKAKSNICSNHQLAALIATVNMAALGPAGLREAAEGSVRNAHALAARLEGDGFRVANEATFFSEFVLRVRSDPARVRRDLQAAGLRAAVPVPEEVGVGPAVLLGATELTRPEEVDALALGLAGIDAARTLEGARG